MHARDWGTYGVLLLTSGASPDAAGLRNRVSLRK
jgi:hypothetical protein